MIINANRISEKGVSFHDTIDADSNLLLEEESYFLEGLNYQIVLKRENRIQAQGKIKTAISLVCVRCLEQFELKINSRFDIILFPKEMVNPAQHVPGRGRLEYIFYENDQIDLEKSWSSRSTCSSPSNPVCTPRLQGDLPRLRHQPEPRRLPLRRSKERNKVFV